MYSALTRQFEGMQSKPELPIQFIQVNLNNQTS